MTDISANKDIKDTKNKGYKVAEPLRTEIYEYLNNRPYTEVDALITGLFEKPDDKDPFWSWEGVMLMIEYLKDKCPRKDVKDFLIKLAKTDMTGLLEYSFTEDQIKKD